MSIALRTYGFPWAYFDLRETELGKTVILSMRRFGSTTGYVDLLELTVVGDRLLYSTLGDKSVLGPTGEEIEHGPSKAS